jgi:hypothetical protein
MNTIKLYFLTKVSLVVNDKQKGSQFTEASWGHALLDLPINVCYILPQYLICKL